MDECSHSLNNYRMSRSLDNWKKFKKIIKNTKRSFFDMKIQEVASKSHGPWELMNWINRHKLSTIKAIKYDGLPCLFLESLIIPLIILSTARLIPISFMKSGVNPLLTGVLSLKRNSSKWLANAMTHHHLVLINWLGITWNLSSNIMIAL